MDLEVIVPPVVAGIVAVYGIVPDVLNKDASRWKRISAAALVVIGVLAAGWAAYTANRDQRYVALGQTIQDVNSKLYGLWQEYLSAVLSDARQQQGLEALQQAQEALKQGDFAKSNRLSNEAARVFEPDVKRLKALPDKIRFVMSTTTQSILPQDIQYRVVLFCITLETLVRLHSDTTPMSPSFLFGVIMADTRGREENHLHFTPEWSQVTWYTGFFRPSDFGPPTHILRVDPDGRLVIDSAQFDENFLLSRAEYLVEWFHDFAF